MSTLPSNSLVLYDTAGVTFGTFHIAPNDDGTKLDGIFDVEAVDEEQAARPEVRWLCKRHYKRWSEHRVKLDEEGVLTITKASFKVVFEPMEGGGFLAAPPAPPVTAFWDES